jgi:dihydrofolate reductase
LLNRIKWTASLKNDGSLIGPCALDQRGLLEDQEGNLAGFPQELERRMSMGKVVTGFSMSLDGFVAGPNDSVEKPLGQGGEGLFAWYSTGDTEFRFPSGTFVVQVSRAFAEELSKTISAAGALVTGRRTFDLTNGWGGRHPLDVPVVVVTHREPPEWVKAEWPFTFVTDGFETAMEEARQVAGDKNIIAGSPSIAKQCLEAGLLDEVTVDLVPLLLGHGVRLFEPVGSEPIGLETMRVIEDPGVTHVFFRIVKQNKDD